MKEGRIELFVVVSVCHPAFECCDSRVEDRAAFLKDSGVPEAEDRIAVGIKPSGTVEVVLAIGMLGAVEFDDEAFLATNEVGYVRAERNLAGELVAVETSVSKIGPQLMFGVGFIMPEFASAAGRP